MKTENRRTMVAFGCFIAALVMVSAFFTARNGGVDELGFWNPPYMLSHFGRLTFPVFPGNVYFDLPVITHPPIHTFEIGVLRSLGFGMYYAEAMPALLLYLLAIVLIVRAPFPAPMKLGLLFSIGYLMAAGETLVLSFGTRPEGELHAAWFCGLLLLEWGRRADWDRPRLAAGAFFLTWASGLHYYAGLAFLGVLVYAGFAVRSLPWREARPRLAAMLAGGCLFGLPYVFLYLLPHLSEILWVIHDLQGSGGLMTAIHRHFEMYQAWVRLGGHPALIRAAMATRIPLVIYSTLILAALKNTRALALAALPLQAGLVLLARHKLDYYLIHETALFAAAVAIGVVTLVEWLVCRAPDLMQRVWRPVAAVALAIGVAIGSPLLAAARISLQPRIHEIEVARAAAREILGADGRVGGPWGEWYASGGTHWFNTQADMQPGRLAFEPRAYFSNLDAVVDCPNFCVGSGDSAPSKWFADGTLNLRGFYFGETNDQLQLVLLSARQPVTLAGYVSERGQVYRFGQDESGSKEVVSAVCPIAGELGQWGWSRTWPGVFSTVLQMPRNSPDAGRVLVVAVMPRFADGPARWISTACRTLSATAGTLAPVDRKALVERMRRDDPPMHFYRNLDEVPGYAGVGLPPDMAPPAGLVPVKQAIDLASLHPESGATLQSGRLTTIPKMGGFSASIPLHTATTGPIWMEFRLRIVRGQVGLLAWNATSGTVLGHTMAIESAPESQTVAFQVSDPRTMTHIILTNESSASAQVEVQSASILVRP